MKLTNWSLEQFGLDRLIESKKNTEKYYGQFEVSQARVKRLAKEFNDKEWGDYVMFTPIRVAILYDDYLKLVNKEITEPTYYLIGGRHRIEAIKLLVETKPDECDASLEWLNGYVIVEVVTLIDQIGKFITADNGSRSVNQAERMELNYGLKEYAQGEFPIDKEDGGLAELKNSGVKHYGVKERTQTRNTLVSIWKRVLNELNKVCKKEIQSLVYGDYETQLQFAEVFQECYDEVVSDLKGCARKHCPVADNIVNLLQEKLDFIPIITKKDSGVDKSTHEWIHSDKVAEACLPTDVTSIKERLAKKEEEIKVNEEDFSCF